MAKGKNVLTTGDVARICNVAPRTVSKWFDSGQLKGYRIPGSKDRRIPVTELIRFMKAHNMPTDIFPVGQTRVLVVNSDAAQAAQLAETLATKGNYEVEIVSTNFETGLIAHKFAPHIMLINLLDDVIETTNICDSIRKDEQLQTIRMIAITNNLGTNEKNALLQRGFDDNITIDSKPEEIISKIEEATAIIY